MAISTQIQNLNLIPGKSAPVVVHLSQGNVGNTVQFYLYDGDNPYYPTNVSIAVHGVRADGTSFGPYTVSTSTGSNLVSFNVSSPMVSVAGACVLELVITDPNQNQVGTANFGMLVESAPYSSSVTYEDDLSIYQRILAYVKSIPAGISGQIADEAQTRATEIATLTSKLDTETSARQSADTANSSSIASLQSSLGSEITRSTNKDTELQNQINQIIAPTGGAPSAAEVTDARIGANGTTYSSLGVAIRTQTKDLDDKILSWNSEDLIWRMDHQNRTLSGITFTWTGKNTVKVSGTSTDITSTNLVVGALPSYLSVGGTYHVYFSDDVVWFRVYFYTNTSWTSMISEAYYTKQGGTFTIPAGTGGVIIRIWLPKGVTVNKEVSVSMFRGVPNYDLSNRAIQTNKNGTGAPINSCNNALDNSIYFVSSANGVTTPPDFPLGRPGWLTTIAQGSVKVQFAVPYVYEFQAVKTRRYIGGAWGAWYDCGAYTGIYDGTTDAIYSSCDDVNSSGAMFIASSGGTPTLTGFPYSEAGFLQTTVTGNFRLQIAYPYSPNANTAKWRIKRADGWSSWNDLGSGSGGSGQTITIEQEISRDTYNNTYNITATPEITTDTNGWLNAVDSDTESESGKTDMTPAIMAMLSGAGYCHLGPGIFYVSGNIDIPTGATLEGCGNNTCIRLLSSVTSGYICRLKEYGKVRSIRFSGGYNAGDISTPDIGGRKGVIFIGNRDGQDSEVTPTTTKCSQITGCTFENLDSGIYGYNAGGGLQEGLIVSDCYITRCKAGINLDYWTEYCKFSNVVTFQCYFACINNGGNNVFVGCTFHGVEGFVLDNSAGNKSNQGHGSVIGCTFNHIDNMNRPQEAGRGLGIKMIGNTAGFVFSGCQLWYGEVYVENSRGVSFADCLFGGGSIEITTTGSYPLFLNGCTFQSAPNVSAETAPKYTGCYTFTGDSVNAS